MLKNKLQALLRKGAVIIGVFIKSTGLRVFWKEKSAP